MRISSFLACSVLLLLITSCGSKSKSLSRQAYMSETYAELKKGLPDAEVQLLNDTVKLLFPESLLFEFGKAEVKKMNYSSLNTLAEVLKKFSKSKILITGFTDNVGEKEVNLVLSENRALNTKKVLEEMGVQGARIFTWGRGERDPIDSNKTAEGRKKNRRVEFVILYEYSE